MVGLVRRLLLDPYSLIDTILEANLYLETFSTQGKDWYIQQLSARDASQETFEGSYCLLKWQFTAHASVDSLFGNALESNIRDHCFDFHVPVLNRHVFCPFCQGRYTISRTGSLRGCTCFFLVESCGRARCKCCELGLTVRVRSICAFLFSLFNVLQDAVSVLFEAF